MTEHTAKHDLPINGYGTQTGEGGLQRVSVYCGRCRESYTPDRAWVNRYFASVKKEIERQIAGGRATTDALVSLLEERDEVLVFIAAHDAREGVMTRPRPAREPAPPADRAIVIQGPQIDLFRRRQAPDVADRFRKERDRQKRQADLMWLGAMTLFSDHELRLLNDLGSLSQQDRDLLAQAGRSVAGPSTKAS